MIDTIILKKYGSPCGTLIMGAYGEQLCLCDWTDENNQPRSIVANRLKRLLNAELIFGENPINDKAIQQLEEYFHGKRKTFNIPLLHPGTDFQQAAWEGLLHIPYGKTISYAEQAKALGIPKAVRAIASANRANAISIIVPCHRVIGSNHSLTGYAGGLDAKGYLIDLEKKHI